LGEKEKTGSKKLGGGSTDNDGRVVERITDDKAAFASKGWDDCTVGGEAHAENDSGGLAWESV
jgi:hypothetical protein